MMPRLLDSILPKKSPRVRRNRFQPELMVLEDRANPAQLWVGPSSAMTILNDVGAPGLSNGDIVRMALPGNQFTTGTFGTTVFNTVESAVQAANSNADPSNTIRILGGSYTLGVPQLDISKNLSMIGFGEGTTSVKAGMSTTTNGASPTADSSATILVNRGVQFNLISLTLDGGSLSGIDDPVLLKYTDSGSGSPVSSMLSSVAIKDVQALVGGTPTTAGVGVYDADGNVIVTNSTFQNIGTNDVLYTGSNATGSVLGSTFTGQGAGPVVNIAIGSTDSGAVTVAGNTISGFLGSSGGTDSAGVSIQGPLSFTPTVTVQNNQLTGNLVGVSLGSLLNLLSSTTSISNNNFVGNTLAGISSLTSGTLSGLQNFYQGNGTNVTGLLPGVTLPSLAPVTSTPPSGSIASIAGTISGRVTDGNGNGVAGVTVYIDTNYNGTLDPTEIAVTTDANGNFTFSGLPVLNLPTLTYYQVRLVVPSGDTPGTTSVNVSLNPLQLSVSGLGLDLTVSFAVSNRAIFAV